MQALPFLASLYIYIYIYSILHELLFSTENKTTHNTVIYAQGLKVYKQTSICVCRFLSGKVHLEIQLLIVKMVELL